MHTNPLISILTSTTSASIDMAGPSRAGREGDMGWHATARESAEGCPLQYGSERFLSLERSPLPL
jgi:hypothetical protein